MSWLRALLVSAGILLVPLAAQAQSTIPWADTGTDFATGSDWTGGIAPVTGDTAQFATPSPTFQPNLAANYSVNGVQFTAGAGTFNLSGAGTLSVGSAGID